MKTATHQLQFPPETLAPPKPVPPKPKRSLITRFFLEVLYLVPSTIGLIVYGTLAYLFFGAFIEPLDIKAEWIEVTIFYTILVIPPWLFSSFFLKGKIARIIFIVRWNVPISIISYLILSDLHIHH